MKEYQSVQEKLNEVVGEYKSNQEQYNASVDGSQQEGILLIDKDEMKATLQKYAKDNLIDIDYEIRKAQELNSISSEFTYCDIYFTVKGEYYDIDKFIDSIEKDFSLNFTVTEFEMRNSQDTIKADFVVKNVAIKED